MQGRLIQYLVLAVFAVFLAGCGGSTPSKFKTYNGPAITQVVVEKEKRRMYLYHHNRVIKKYRIGLGFTPDGQKIYEGDGRTPEGNYYIDRRNPNSSFHLSIGISYPNAQDLAFADYMGIKPGGDIFIHGQPNRQARKKRGDWTAGCIAVTNKEIEEIYAMVRNGTPISIRP